MSDNIFDKWEKSFRADASADDFAIFRDHLRRMDLPDKPDLMLEGTILLVRRCFCYAVLDTHEKAYPRFLAMQTYDPAKARGADYAYTFNIHGMSFARVFVEAKSGTPDLADMYGCPWHEYQVCGFNDLWISRPDWSSLSKDETATIEREVRDDIFYDYEESELHFSCEGDFDETYVWITIQDADEDEDDDDDDT